MPHRKVKETLRVKLPLHGKIKVEPGSGGQFRSCLTPCHTLTLARKK
jgi:hypothetical protein